MNNRITKYIDSLSFWWIVLTLVYIPLTFLNDLLNEGSISVFVSLIGLFVPIGFLSIFGIFLGTIWAKTLGYAVGLIIGLVAMFVTLTCIFLGDRWIKKSNVSFFTKIILIFLILFLLTMFVDYSVIGQLG